MHRTSGEIVTEKEKHDRANEIATALSDHSRRHTGGRSRSATCTSSVCESQISARTTNLLMQSADTTYFCV